MSIVFINRKNGQHLNNNKKYFETNGDLTEEIEQRNTRVNPKFFISVYT